MPTTFDEVIDIALVTIRDYKLDKIYNDPEIFNQYVDGFLIKAIPSFTECFTSLKYDITNRTFLEELSPIEIDILADLWDMEWFKAEVQDTRQFNLHLNDTDFKHYAEGQNLKEKSEYLDRMREKVAQKIVDYQLKNIKSIPYFNP